MQGSKANAGQPGGNDESTRPADNGATERSYDRGDDNRSRDRDDRDDRDYGRRDRAPVGGGLRAAFGSRRDRALPRDGNSRMMNELTAKMNDIYDGVKNTDLRGVELSIIPAPKGSLSGANNHTNKIGMIILLVGFENRYAYHSLLLQSEMSQQPVQRQNDFGYSADRYRDDVAPVPRTPSTLADDALATLIHNKVKGMVPNDAFVSSADWSNVPDDFQIDVNTVRYLFNNAYDACYSEIEGKLSPGSGLRMAGHVENDDSNVANLFFNYAGGSNNFDVYDAAGQPIRADIVIDFKSEPRQADNRNRDRTENSADIIEFGTIACLVDVNIDPVQARRSRWGNSRRSRDRDRDDDTQEYSASVIITDIVPYMGSDIASVLLMVQPTLSLIDVNDRHWARAFLPRHLAHVNGSRSGGLRPNDIGALNYDYGLEDKDGEVVPFNTMDEKNFTDRDFDDLIDDIFRPAASLGIDIPECAHNTWLLRQLLDEGRGGEARIAALEALNAATGGAFAQRFDMSGRTPIMQRENQLILMGTHMDNGKKYDLREVTGTYLENLVGHENPDIFKQWQATMGDSDEQLAARAKILTDNLSDVNFTGIAYRRFFEPDFLEAWDGALEDIGLRVSTNLTNAEARSNYRYGTSMSQRGALVNDFSSKVFTRGRQSGGGRKHRSFSSNYRSYGN